MEERMPEISEWLTIKEAAQKLKIPEGKIRYAITRGRIAQGERVRLKAWKTLKGIITTEKAILAFSRQLGIYRGWR